VSVREGSLAAAFADLPDPRRATSVVYPLPAVLALVVAALLAGQVSVLAIAQWAARQEGAQLEALGFPPGRIPCQTTLHRLLRKLPGRPLSALQQVSLAPSCASDPRPQDAPGLQGVAIDGKGQRGRLRRSGASYAKHALSALEHTTGRVLAHAPLGPRPHLAPTELDAVPDLIARIPWRGRVLTADSLFCQRTVCQAIREAGGDYLLPVKGNQPRLRAFVEAHFTDTQPQGAGQTAWTEEAGHGRTADRRELTLRPIAANPLAWPGLTQVFRQVRTWQAQGTAHHSVHYGITSLAPNQASAAQVLAVRRGHWSIENALHRQKDVLFREDASQVHQGSAPAVLSLLRDAAITLLHLTGSRDLAARTRALSQFPHLALTLVCHPIPTRA
jgi:predicted transposase YbfD/YdcC